MALGAEFQVNTTTTNTQDQPSIAALPEGGFVVSWTSAMQDGSGYGVYAQRYDASGVAQGGEFLVNTTTTNTQNSPAIAALADGGFAMSWSSTNQDGSSEGIYAQQFYISSFEGTAGDDVESGFLGRDLINGYAGNDRLSGNGGEDTINGGDGNDRLNGGDGDDLLDGGLGHDTAMYSSAGSAVTVDLNHTGFQNTGGAGVDRLTSIQSVFGSAYGDTLTGNAYANTLSGGGGDDTLIGGGGDRLYGGAGADQMTGGAGIDLYVVDNAGDVVTELLDEGRADEVRASVDYRLTDHVERLVLTGSGAITGTGNALANVIIGNSMANGIDGAEGDDRLSGMGGNDFLSGGIGRDTLYGGIGGDQLDGGEGNDRLNGGDGDDWMAGGEGNDRMDGGLGADEMIGGAGSDIYMVDNAGDIVTEAAGGGTLDQIVARVSYSLSAEVEVLVLAGTNAIDGTGNALANAITGNAAANRIDGGDGNDRIDARAGNDRLLGGLGNDRLTGGTGADTFVFDTALDASTNVDKIIDFTIADDTIELDQSVFTALSLGTLSTDAFRTGTAAQDADDRIIYDSATGRIFYDADGSGAGAQVLFAQVTAGLAITNADFLVG